jgi:spoIIIJ-associated protein
MEHSATLEVIAPTIDEAVQKGLEELGVEVSHVDIEVLDEGGSGFLGLGGRQARVRLTVRQDGKTASSGTTARVRAVAPPLSPADAENLLAIAKATVQALLEHMDVRAEIQARMGEPDEPGLAAPVLIDINGGDLSFLIGRHAETLNALQLVTRLIVGKEVGQPAHIVIDISGYRQRREEGLRQLAQRMAQQAISTGRHQTLEPMTPAERRIIHMELRESQEVTTESTGEEPRRKVVIIPR